MHSVAQHALLVEPREGALRVVFRLERAVRRAAVVALELLGGEEAVRVERLDAAELDHLALDEPVEVTRRMRLARALHVPEAEVDVPAALHRIEREAPGTGLRPDGADPLRPKADVLGVEGEELGRARERDVDVLD